MSRHASDLSGRRVGTWTVEEPTDIRDHGSVVWLCKCDCGRTRLVASRDIVRRRVRPCDAYADDSATVAPGAVFGALTVEAVNGSRARVRCECGREKDVEARDLARGAVTSCGCGIERLRRAAASCGAVDGTRLSSLTQRTRTRSASGVKGVTRGSVEGSWMARIKLAGEEYYLGQYPSLDEAVAARRRAEDALYGPVLRRYGRGDD